jgi:hypothetical protein
MDRCMHATEVTHMILSLLIIKNLFALLLTRFLIIAISLNF